MALRRQNQDRESKDLTTGGMSIGMRSSGRYDRETLEIDQDWE